jgi:mitochondrial fission protein ELM1
MSDSSSRAPRPNPRRPRSTSRKAGGAPGQPEQKPPAAPPDGIAPGTVSAHSPRPHSESQPRVWLVLGDKEGDNAQVHAIERALGWSCERRHVQMREPWIVGKPRILPSLHHIDRARSDALEPPWPDLVITIGRRPSMVALWIAEQSGGHTRLVLVGKPSGMMRRFDLVVASAEINLPPFDNVVPIALPLMGVEASRIAASVEVWRERLAELPRPLIAFLVGGATRPFAFDRTVTERLIELAREAIVAGGTPYFSTSRRTSLTTVDALRAGLPAAARIYRWTTGDTDNPYLGLLGLADGFVVTSDSISMLVEVIRLRRPLGILELRPRGFDRLELLGHTLIGRLCTRGTASAASAIGKSIARGLHRLGLFDGTRDIPAFCRMLFERGFAVPAGDPLLPPRGKVPDDLGRVVARIRALMGLDSRSAA